MNTTDLDPVWESAIYSQGNHLNLYPFDSVVSYVFRYRPKNKNRKDTKIIEVGCGAGNNLWFAAREGFMVTGIDGSKSAISFAEKRFQEDELKADLRVGSFLKLPWENNSFDMGIDRGSLVCVNYDNQKTAVEEMRRVLIPGGMFLSTSYSDKHTSAHSGTILEDGRITNIKAGKLAGVGSLCFNSKEQLLELFAKGWNIISLEEKITSDIVNTTTGNTEEIHAEWNIIAQKRKNCL